MAVRPFAIVADEASEGSADLVFLPQATAADWAAIFAYAEASRVADGLAVVQVGEEDRSLYLLTEGEVAVRLSRGEAVLKSVEAPAVLGELAFLDGRPRSATLQAVGEVEVARLSPEAFQRLAEERPALALTILADLGRILALRLRLATDALADLRG